MSIFRNILWCCVPESLQFGLRADHARTHLPDVKSVLAKDGASGPDQQLKEMEPSDETHTDCPVHDHLPYQRLR